MNIHKNYSGKIMKFVQEKWRTEVERERIMKTVERKREKKKSESKTCTTSF